MTDMIIRPHSNLACTECGQEASLYVPSTDSLICSDCEKDTGVGGVPLPPTDGEE